MANPDVLINGCQLEDGKVVNIHISQGHIVDVSPKKLSAQGVKIDAHGLIALPSFVDLHTHLRQPGFEQSETVLTGTRAAAAGGYTTVFAMPNTSPIADNAAIVEQVQRLGDESGYAFVQPIGAVTKNSGGGELADLGDMASSQAHVRVFSDDGKCVSDPLIMRRALEYVKTFDGVIAQHAQDPQLTVDAQMNEGEISAQLGLKGWPAVAEESIIARDVLLAEFVGSRLHVCHVSTAGSVDVIRWAKKRGINVTAEVTPHHLLLTEQKVLGYDARYKVNPPLRSQEDVLALRNALADGTIDIVATDHAPHPSESKECEWDAAAFGMVGLESAFSVVYSTMVKTELMDWKRFVEVMTVNPARIGFVNSQPPFLSQGQQANVVLVEPSVTYGFSEDDLRGMSRNSPYLGMELSGRVHTTIHHGYLTLLDGQLRDVEEVQASSKEFRFG